MYHLGIPTTRAATCIVTDDMVTRDVNYDGNPIEEQVSLVVRIARTFLRYGRPSVLRYLLEKQTLQ